MFPLNHKTVFILDHSSYFSQGCNQPMEYDVVRTKGAGFIPAPPIEKSMWTCNVEGMFEYMRIIHDIYPQDKLFRVVVGSKVLNQWDTKDLNSILMHELAVIGPPKAKKDEESFSVIHGLSHAIECLSQPTPQQASRLEDGDIVKNKGMIICVTAVQSVKNIKSLEEYVVDSITQLNKMASTSSQLPIEECEVTFIHTQPVGTDVTLVKKPRTEISSRIYSEFCVSHSGRLIYNQLVLLCCNNFQLVSTTVTGIPMKEEQNASSSANYDVELLHPARAHSDLFKSEHAEGLVIPSKEGLPIETAPLKWCTPKSSVIELHNCSDASRICPVDVNSRPSSCLTNFLLSGRAVMLEQPRKSGTKVLSHMLAAHGGEIFIHSIPTNRSILEDPPSISEGCGGRVTDYRITAFGEFMKEHRLAPTNNVLMNKYGPRKPFLYAIRQLERSSRVWPMVISETIIFNLSTSVSPLPQLLLRESLSMDEVLECKKVIYRIVDMENKNEPLPVPASGTRGKGPKREEQYRQLWAELESLCRAYCESSDEHNEVLTCLLECKRPTGDDTSNVIKKTRKEESLGGLSDAENSWKEFDKYQKMTEREKKDYLHTSKTDTDKSPVKKLKTEDLLMRSGGQTLMSMWSNRLKQIHSKRYHELDGRIDEGDDHKTRLYIHLDEDKH